MIRLDYKNDKPLHEQITQGIKDLIICGVLASGDQLPSVRELSVNLTVNPNTFYYFLNYNNNDILMNKYYIYQ